MIQMLPDYCVFFGMQIFQNVLGTYPYPDLNGTAIIVNRIIMVAAHVRFLALSLWEARSDFADVQLNCKDGVLHLNRFC